MSTTVTINSSPASMKTTVTWASIGNTGTAKTTSQIVTFDLSVLGANPTVESAVLKATSTHDANDDKFTAQAGGKSTGAFTGATGVDLTAAVRDAVASQTIDVTTQFLGVMPTPPQYSQQSSTVAYMLVVTVAGSIDTDKRSTGTLSASSINFGQSVTITVEPKNQNYAHKVTWQLGKYTRTDPVIGTALTFTLSDQWADALPSATSGTMKVTLDTLDNGVSAGTREYSVRVTIPDTAAYRPSCGNLSWSAVNQDALAGDDRLFKGASRIRLTLPDVAAGKGSSIASIVWSGWGDSMTSTASPVTTNMVQKSGTIELKAVVTDSRGKTVTKTVQATVYEYTPPYFTSIQWARYPDENGSALQVTSVFGCSRDVFPNNTATATVQIRPKGSSTSWDNVQTTALTSGTAVIVTAVTLDPMVGYELRFVVKDQAMSVTRFATLSTRQFVLHFLNNAVGVGQVAEAPVAGEDGRLSVNPDWAVSFGTNVMIGSQTLAEYIQSIVTAMQGS